MREIKFRGKRVDNGEWVYGDLTYYPFVGIRVNGRFNRVIPETVGQYTGLKDKEGKEIYEGDIVKVLLPPFNENSLTNISNHEVSIKNTGYFIGEWNFHGSYYFGCVMNLEIYVIGNIHDNKELLTK